MTAHVVIIIVAILLLLALAAGLLLAEHRAQQRRGTWSPFGPDGKLRDDLFTPVSEGGQGFTKVGAFVDDSGVEPRITTAVGRVWVFDGHHWRQEDPR